MAPVTMLTSFAQLLARHMNYRQRKLLGWPERQLGSEYGERGMQRAAAVGNDLGSKGHTISPY